MINDEFRLVVATGDPEKDETAQDLFDAIPSLEQALAQAAVIAKAQIEQAIKTETLDQLKVSVRPPKINLFKKGAAERGMTENDYAQYLADQIDATSAPSLGMH